MSLPRWMREWREANAAPLYAATLIALLAFIVGSETLDDVSVDSPGGRQGLVQAPGMPPSSEASPTYGASTDPRMWFASPARPSGSRALVAAPHRSDEEVLALEAEAGELATIPETPGDPETPVVASPTITSTPAVEAHSNATPAPAPPTPSPRAEAPTPTPAPPTPAPGADNNFHLPSVSAGPMTELERRLLDGLNAERTAAGMAAYSYDAGLSVVARTRSQQMVDQGYFAHTDPYGYSMYVELLAHFGYRYAWAGENLAMNNFGNHESPERAVAALMNSSSHRENILSESFSRVGVGVAHHADGRKFYTMIFLG